MLRRSFDDTGAQMRHTARFLLAAAFAASVVVPVAAPPGLAPSGRAWAQGQPPHAWLFGTWTGGLFPAPSGLSAQTCQPVAIFTRDVVMRATLLDPNPVQRVIETVRATPAGTEFRFVAVPPAPASGGLLDLAAPPTTGFGCADPDALVVQRRGANEIAFPGCADFPNPLVRCPER